MNNIINLVLVLFFMMVVGFYGRRKQIINQDMSKGLSNIILNITLPLMIISSFNYEFSKESLNIAYKGFLLSIVIHIAIVFSSKAFYFKFDKDEKAVLRFITIFSNCGYMGYPVLESIYGKIGVFYGAIYNIPFNILLWTIGVMLFTGNKDSKNFKKAFFNPGVISVTLGLIIFIYSIKLPYPIMKTIESIGSMTTPISMMVVGAMLADIKLKELFAGKAIFYGAFIRLLFLPVAVLGILKLLGIEKILMDVAVIIVAMPAAVNTVVFSENYNGNSVLSSKIVFLTTMLSMVTIPLILLLIQL